MIRELQIDAISMFFNYVCLNVYLIYLKVTYNQDCVSVDDIIQDIFFVLIIVFLINPFQELILKTIA